MKRILLTLTLCLSVSSLIPLPARAVDMSWLAPADRYFGHLKMSILGIRNALNDLSARIDVYPEDAEHVFDKTLLVEDALHDWQHQFPHDPWIPKYAFTLAQLYAKIGTDGAREHRHDMVVWLLATYPQSEFAALARE
jgi:hypothetical protein